MKVLLFGATGVVGQGVLEECLLDPSVESVLSIVRVATEERHEKLIEIVHTDFFDFSAIESHLSGFDACFFCLGISSMEINEESYRWVTHDVTMTVAQTLARLNPTMTFIYVLSMGTGSDGRLLWARMKGETESALRGLPVKAYMLHPARVVPIQSGRGGIRPRENHGLRGLLSKEAVSRLLWTAISPLLPLLEAWFPRRLTTTGQVGLAMLRIARHGAPQRILENRDINALPIAS